MNNRQYDELDLINILSFILGILNYNENLTQGDKQDLMDKLEHTTSRLLAEVHEHLEQQDRMLKELLDEKNKKVSG